MWLPQPQWTDEYSVAINAVDPADYQDAWRLGEGFVAMEGKNILPSLANRVSNIAEIHTSILLYCFLEAGLLNALIDVIVSSATFISVRATILIGMILSDLIFSNLFIFRMYLDFFILIGIYFNRLFMQANFCS